MARMMHVYLEPLPVIDLFYCEGCQAWHVLIDEEKGLVRYEGTSAVVPVKPEKALDRGEETC